MKTLLIWLWLSQASDVASTAAALHQGCVEATYWSGQPAAIAGGKIAGSIVISFGAPRMARGGKALVASFAGAATAATILNLRTLPRCSK